MPLFQVRRVETVVKVVTYEFELPTDSLEDAREAFAGRAGDVLLKIVDEDELDLLESEIKSFKRLAD